MTKQGRLWVLLALWATGLATVAQAAERQTLAGHVPSAVRSMTAVGRLPQTNRLHLSIGLPLRNTNQLQQLLQEIYDPASTNFHRYLTPEEFTQRFGPTEEDYAAVTRFCHTNGLIITSLHSNRTIVGVSARSSDVERVFNTRLNLYRHPRQDRLFYAPETEPTVGLATRILHVQGLNNINPPRPLSKRVPLAEAAQPRPNGGSGTGGSLMGKDFRLAYAPGVALNGSNQILGLLEFDGYYPGDITNYLTKAGLARVPLKNVLVDGFNGVPGPNNGEVSMDIQVAIGMAPGLKQILVYEAGGYSTADSILNRIANDNTAKQISCSWTWGDQSLSTDQIFQQIAVQGQSFFQAAGDWGSWAPGTAIDAPADNPYATVVGGTTLTTAADGSWVGETVWDDPDGYGTGGGFSASFSLPSWQAGMNLTGAGGSTKKRNVPDVALVAENVMSIADNGVTYLTRGTSISAPLWGAYAAMINQQAAANGQPNIGFVNPVVYALGKSSSYSRAFHDTIMGNNDTNKVPVNFYAAGGYDLCTGWGTPTGSNTINALLQVANGQVDHFSWMPLQTIMPGTPFNATLNAQALDNTLVSSFNGTASVSAVQIQTNMLFSRDFDSGTLTDWNSEGGGYTAAIDSTNGAAGSPRSFFLTGGNGGSYDGVSHPLSSITPDKVEFYIKAPANNLSCGYFVAGSDKYRSNSVFHFRMESTGTMGLTDGQGGFYTTNYLANRWYKIDLLLDWTNKVVDYYVNDALVASRVPFCNPKLASLATANLYNFDKAQVWYDQISVSKASSSSVALSPAGTVRFTNGTWSGSLTIAQAYTNALLTASDDLWHVGSSRPFAVQATAPPSITAHPASLVVNPGSPATFSVAATGAGPLFYFWQKNGAPLPSATGATYTVAAAQWADSGSLFSCIVSNAGGPVASQSAKLTVRPTFGGGSITTNAFQVILNGAPGSNYVIQTSVDLTNWVPWITIPGIGQQSMFVDTNLSAPYRFYRISGAP